jgi:DDRGK domain-containing protein 1
VEREAEEEKHREMERKAQEEKERKEHEEYLKLKEAFSVESEGFDETEGDGESNSLMAFIQYIKVFT